jgi:hypothetical protein
MIHGNEVVVIVLVDGRNLDVMDPRDFYTIIIRLTPTPTSLY